MKYRGWTQLGPRLVCAEEGGGSDQRGGADAEGAQHRGRSRPRPYFELLTSFVKWLFCNGLPLEEERFTRPHARPELRLWLPLSPELIERIAVRQDDCRELCLRSLLLKSLTDAFGIRAAYLPGRAQCVMFERRVDVLSLAQYRKVAQCDRASLGVVTLACVQKFKKMIDTAGRHGSDAPRACHWVERNEDLACTLEVPVGVSKVQQLETGERGEDSAIPAQEILETAGGESAFVDEAKADGPHSVYKDGEFFGKQMHASRSNREEVFTQAECLSEEVMPGLRGIEQPITEVVKDEVQDHEAALDVGIALQSAVLRSTQPDCGVHLSGREVIDKASLPAGDALEMTKCVGFPQELHSDSSALPANETVILAAKEIAGMQDDQVQERSLAFRVSHRLQHWDGIVAEVHRSRTSRIMKCSFSIFAVMEARSAPAA